MILVLSILYVSYFKGRNVIRLGRGVMVLKTAVIDGDLMTLCLPTPGTAQHTFCLCVVVSYLK